MWYIYLPLFFEKLVAVSKSDNVWPASVPEIWYFRVTTLVQIWCQPERFKLEDGGRSFWRNFGKFLPDCTESVTFIFTVVRTHNVAYGVVNYVAP